MLNKSLAYKVRIKRILILIFSVLQLIGIAAILLGYTAKIIHLTPFHLLFAASILLIDMEHVSLKSLLFFLFVCFFGLGVEMIGVNTGIPFGHYTYGESLGIKVFATPLVMAINWFLVVFLSCSISDRVSSHACVKILLGGCLALLLDFFIEPVAPLLDYWVWESGVPPSTNFLSWFLLSAFFVAVYIFLNVRINSTLAPILYLEFLCFFALIQTVST
jgi:bisanhydrobacterioruberin hydratase